MKLRNGFVSNSSTSSFLIYGTQIDKSELERVSDSLWDENLYQQSEEYYEDKIWIGASLKNLKNLD